MRRKLDAAIAEALGNRVVYSENDCDWLAWDGDSDSDWIVPRYSTDGNAMLDLDREVRERGFELDLQIIGKYCVAGYYVLENEIGGIIMQHAEAEPLARALAAYKALTSKEWEVI